MGLGWAVGALAWLALGLPARVASGSEPLEEIVVVASRVGSGPAHDTSSEGVVFSADLGDRPLLRPGELLESVPGLIVTQHSGDGKANQYFLRGFNLDHGTDFATSVDGLPMNMPTHAHGQGYTDLNSLIPELVERIDYRKGPYFAEQGDFSAAGAAGIHYVRRLETDIASVSVGDEGYRRGVAALSGEVVGGDVLFGVAAGHDDGPWVLPEDFRSFSGVLKFSRGDATDGFSLEAMGYDGLWHSTDQIPERAVEEGLISRFGAIDPSGGGTSHRYSVSADRWVPVAGGELRATIYVIGYFLDLFSDFTYFDDPVHGDQFEQFDQRRIYGGSVEWDRSLTWAACDVDLRVGVQVRDDRIAPVGLYDTTDRIRWRTVSETRVNEVTNAGYLTASTKLAPWWRLELGLRADAFRFDVAAERARNSGDALSSIVSPKASMVLGPWAGTEFFLNAGRGFHSNDARGTTITADPTDHTTPVARVTPLVRAFGAEVGLRTTAIPTLALAATAWTLSLDSELTLDNDASAIAPSGATRRYGLEFSAAYRPQLGGVTLDADLAWTHARYTDFQPEGQYLPNSLEQVASIGLTLDRGGAWFGGARLRYVGAAPVTRDDSIRSRSSLQLSTELGFRLSPACAATLSVFNLLNQRTDDIEYYYASQLRGEPAPVNDVHFHPAEPRSVRAGIRYRF
jgi:hypothetical protein